MPEWNEKNKVLKSGYLKPNKNNSWHRRRKFPEQQKVIFRSSIHHTSRFLKSDSPIAIKMNQNLKKPSCKFFFLA